MKRQAFVRELRRDGCGLARQGGRHDVYRNATNGKQAPVLGHREVAETLCEVIRGRLGIEVDLPERG